MQQKLPNICQTNVLYYADTAYVPYGPRSDEEIRGCFNGSARLVISPRNYIAVVHTSDSLIIYEHMAKQPTNGLARQNKTCRGHNLLQREADMTQPHFQKAQPIEGYRVFKKPSGSSDDP